MESGGRRGTSRAVEDYLKAIFKLQESVRPVPTSALAGELGLSAASVTNMVKGLAERGLLDHEPYRGVELTPEGESAALRIIRRHRVIETYLIDRLGYTWDGVHAEAERLEHAASDDLVDRMARALGEPAQDPHGAPIPARDGTIARRALPRLADVEPGARVVIREVADDDAERLRFLGENGFLLGTIVTVKSAAPGEPLRVEVEGSPRRLSRELAAAVRVEPC
jgi:DtxR family transcriptional regulator, Mn-dependent transcriptional regulator